MSLLLCLLASCICHTASAAPVAAARMHVCLQGDCASLEKALTLLDRELPHTMSMVLSICNRVNTAAGGSAASAVDLSGTAVALSSPTTLKLSRGHKAKMAHAYVAWCAPPRSALACHAVNPCATLRRAIRGLGRHMLHW